MIKKITPITYLLVSSLVLTLSLVLLAESKKELVNKNIDYFKYKEVSANYLNLKKNWDSSKYTINTIDKIIKKVKIKGLTKSINKKRVLVKFDTTKVSKIDKFLSKVLNSNLKIIYLNVTTNSLEIEIGI